MQKLIPDTNFLIYLAKYKILDKIKNYELILLKQVLDELERLSKDKNLKTNDRKHCSVVLGFLQNIEDVLEIIEDVPGKADDAILKLSMKERCLVGTMDKELIRRIKKEKLHFIYIRQKKFLEEN